MYEDSMPAERVYSRGLPHIPSVLSLLVLSCFFLSGVAGLIYEVLWVRMIDKVIGSAPFAVATVLSVFMGGLALGSYLAGRYIDRIVSKGKLLSLYGKVELAIGIYGLILPFFITAVKPVYSLTYNYLFKHFWPNAADWTLIWWCASFMDVPTNDTPPAGCPFCGSEGLLGILFLGLLYG